MIGSKDNKALKKLIDSTSYVQKNEKLEAIHIVFFYI